VIQKILITVIGFSITVISKKKLEMNLYGSIRAGGDAELTGNAPFLLERDLPPLPVKNKGFRRTDGYTESAVNTPGPVPFYILGKGPDGHP